MIDTTVDNDRFYPAHQFAFFLIGCKGFEYFQHRIVENTSCCISIAAVTVTDLYQFGVTVFIQLLLAKQIIPLATFNNDGQIDFQETIFR